MAGRIIYPNVISTKIRQMDKNLEELKSHIISEELLLNQTVSSKALLMGQAWNGLTDFVETVQIPYMETLKLWVCEQKASNFIYKTEAAKLPQVTLNADQLEKNLSYWERRLDREYNKRHPSNAVISRCDSMINVIGKKLQAIADFAYATDGLYSDAAQVRILLDKGAGEMKKVSFNPARMTIQFSDISSDYICAISNASAKAYLFTNHIITPEELNALGGFGFIADEIKAAYDAIETDDDKALITGLLKGDYEAAFHANSKNITIPTKMFLSEFLLRVSMSPNSDDKLQKIMNAIVKPEPDTQYPVAGNLGSNGNAFGYIEMLYAGTTNMLELESSFLYAREALPEERYDELVKRNERLMSLATLYGSQYEILSQALDWGVLLKDYISDLSNISISDLKYNEGNNSYAYSISYSGLKRYFSSAGEGISQKIDSQLQVETAIIESQSGMTSQLLQEARRELVKEKEQLGGKLVSDIVGGGGVTYLASVNPVLGAGAALLSGLMESDLGKAYNAGLKGIKASDLKNKSMIDKVFKNENTLIPGKVISALQSYYKRSNELDDEIAEKDEEIRMSWFGTGGGYSIDGGDFNLVVSGAYDPEVIKRIAIWEDSGLMGLMQYRGIETKEIDIEAFMEKLSPDERRLWEGDNILGMDINLLDSAATKLTEKLQGMHFGIKAIKNLLLLE